MLPRSRGLFHRYARSLRCICLRETPLPRVPPDQAHRLNELRRRPGWPLDVQPAHTTLSSSAHPHPCCTDSQRRPKSAPSPPFASIEGSDRQLTVGHCDAWPPSQRDRGAYRRVRLHESTHRARRDRRAVGPLRIGFDWLRTRYRSTVQIQHRRNQQPRAPNACVPRDCRVTAASRQSPPGPPAIQPLVRLR